VDRRFVVDEAYETSIVIQNSLLNAINKPGIVGEVAQALLLLADEDRSMPVDVIRLHGGLPHEPIFIHNPLQPTVILSTVDQVGSRLLFRGYGVSEFMRPVHAALVG
jgi:CRISPR-associated endonuclease/helicase Cas3